MPHVIVPAPYRGPTLGQDRIEVSGATVRECIEAVGAQFPGFPEQIFDADGKVHNFVKLFIDGETIDRQALETPVGAAAEVEILAAIAGG